MLIEMKLAEEIIRERLAHAQKVLPFQEENGELAEEVKTLRVLLKKARRLLLEQSVLFVERA